MIIEPTMDPKGQLSRGEIQSAIDQELTRLAAQGVARWKIRRIRGLSSGLTALAHDQASRVAVGGRVTEQALGEGIRNFLNQINVEQSLAYRKSATFRIDQFQRTMTRREWRRTCCSKLPINTWPFCDPNC